MLLPFVIPARKPPTISNTTSGASASANTTYTFNAQGIGTAAAGRRIVLGFGGHASGVNNLVASSATIGGNAASALVSAAVNVGGDSLAAALYVLQVDAGTTADITFTFSGSTAQAGFGLWAVYNLKSSTAVNTNSATSGSSVSSLSAGLTVPWYGVGIALAHPNPGPGAASTWTGLTKDFDQQGSFGPSGASLAFLAASSPTVQDSFSVTCPAVLLAASLS